MRMREITIQIIILFQTQIRSADVMLWFGEGNEIENEVHFFMIMAMMMEEIIDVIVVTRFHSVKSFHLAKNKLQGHLNPKL